MKATGAQIKEFFENGWPGDDWYWDDNNIEIESGQGDFVLKLTQEYDLDDLGCLYWQGLDDCPRDEYWGFEEAFAEWRDSVEYDVCVVSIPKDSKLALMNFVKLVGGSFV